MNEHHAAHEDHADDSEVGCSDLFYRKNIMEPLEKINASIYNLKRHAKEHGVPACVNIQQRDIRACEKPFPLQGNLANEALGLLRVWAGMNQWKLTEYEDVIDDTLLLTLKLKDI